MPTITKKEAYLKRGGAEMAKIMSNEAARRKMLNHQRPHTVSDLESLKYGHSAQLGKHVRETADTYKSRERIILKQRYVGYPVSVPDLAVDAADETFDRRVRHLRVLEENPKAFKKKFEPECTSDFFHQKHMIRDYLSTMHPYSDPLDRGRTYSVSRLKIKEKELEALAPGDFLQPDDPVRPRTTGYSPGHTRSMLGLDSYGPRSAEKHRIAREKGEIPASPNTDRERAIDNASPSATSYGSRPESPSNSTVSTVPEKRRTSRPSTGHLDDPNLYIPIGQNRGHNYASNNMEMSIPTMGTGVDGLEGDEQGNRDGNSLPLLHPEAQSLADQQPEQAQQQQQQPGLDRAEKKKLLNKVRPNLMEDFEKRFPGFTPSKRAVTADPSYDPRQYLRNRSQRNKSSQNQRSGMRKTSRGGRKPSGVPIPENANTLTGQLGYHGQAIGKAERLLVDPIGRGWEWYHTRNDKKAKMKKIVKKKVKEYDQQVAVDVEIELAKIDFDKFEKALEFRRTAKPADLPENKSQAARKRRGSKA